MITRYDLSAKKKSVDWFDIGCRLIFCLARYKNLRELQKFRKTIGINNADIWPDIIGIYTYGDMSCDGAFATPSVRNNIFIPYGP